MTVNLMKYKGGTYSCDRCEQLITGYSRWLSPIENKGKWQLLCGSCLDELGFDSDWTEQDERDQAADDRFHMLRDEGKI